MANFFAVSSSYFSLVILSWTCVARDRDEFQFLVSGIVRREGWPGMVVRRALGVVRREWLLGAGSLHASGKERVKVQRVVWCGEFLCETVVGNEVGFLLFCSVAKLNKSLASHARPFGEREAQHATPRS